MNLIPRAVKEKMMVELQRSYITTTLPPLLEGPAIWLENVLYGVTADDRPIEKPIFIVGSHRSGTTVLYDSLCKHPSLAYFTNSTALIPEIPILNQRLGDLIGLQDIQLERFFKDGVNYAYDSPSEGIRIWEHYMDPDADHCLDEGSSNPEMDTYLKETIVKHLKHFEKSRFINKNPDNSVRLRYINKIFPDALFIHIIRDARAVCASYLKAQERVREFFGPDHPHAQHGTKVKDWDEMRQMWADDPVAGAGHLWVKIIETIDQDRHAIPDERFIEFHFEDFCADPDSYFRQVIDFCQLPMTPETQAIFDQEAANISLGGRNSSWHKYFQGDDVNRLMEIVSPTMRLHGYEIEDPASPSTVA